MLRPFLQCDDCLWDRFYLRLLTAATICSMLLLRCCYRWLGLHLESLLLKELYRLEFVALHHALNLLKEIYEIPLLAEGPQLCLSLAQLLCQAQCTVKDKSRQSSRDHCIILPAVSCCVSCLLDLNKTPQLSLYTACSVTETSGSEYRRSAKDGEWPTSYPCWTQSLKLS